MVEEEGGGREAVVGSGREGRLAAGRSSAGLFIYGGVSMCRGRGACVSGVGRGRVLRENRMEDFGSALRGVAQQTRRQRGGWDVGKGKQSLSFTNKQSHDNLT